MDCRGLILLQIIVLSSLATKAFSLSPYYYQNICPQALPTIKKVVQAAVYKERRLGASLLRLHFHDCFVNGCDASILLDPSSTIDSEKNSRPNQNSARGFEVIDEIKAEVDKICGRPVVSCADIVAVAARDSVVALEGPSWKVLLGRRDSTTASRTQAEADLPAPFMDLRALINNFKNQGLTREICHSGVMGVDGVTLFGVMRELPFGVERCNAHGATPFGVMRTHDMGATASTDVNCESDNIVGANNLNDTSTSPVNEELDLANVSSTSTTLSTRENHHPMMTRSKCGVFKPKAYSTHFDNNTPSTVQEALQSAN
ncbi:Peroxidase 2 [Hibiscus syriacus]|uniref:Peroxidase n=1 Tax=Hibiscus syriacus TaxID=106335 RepID=A0A6A3BNX8_HIBSY|nr:Peroxidase 2 [Hibiscus syriacus]